MSSAPDAMPALCAEADFLRTIMRFTDKVRDDQLPINEALGLLTQMNITDALEAVGYINGLTGIDLLTQIRDDADMNDEVRERVRCRIQTLKYPDDRISVTNMVMNIIANRF